MKLQLNIPKTLIPKLDAPLADIQSAPQNQHREIVSITADNVDDANYIACEIIPDLIWLSPTYECHDFYTMLNVSMDETIEDCEIYFQSDVEDFIDGDKDEQLFYHYMDERGLLDGDLTAFINEQIIPLGASIKFVE
ncbi:hypothetical protein [Lactobacillus sp. Sy-1]|uniref:hypothetical protein n=1 Tax=Lactobacillus sp. Sy-1 TaxID=2109645 RepID=UPI001C5ABA7E|nr:hypothetical protein [Lactobacillus sp. Sy-1]MBW1606061.1 hypothetical protein [Lactobacillus sp. Sy-1]